MLKFDVYIDGAPGEQLDISGAYMFGQDSVPVRADLTFANGQILCDKRVAGACGLALLWNAGASGQFILSTTRLPDRSKPYNLNIELARGQLMRIAQKREEWGLFDFGDAKNLNEEFIEVRRHFIAALTAIEPARAAVLADKALADAVTLGEKVGLFHANIFLSRRKSSNMAVSRTGFGCRVDLLSTKADYQMRMREAFDFVTVPISWKLAEPKESEYQFDPIDAWVNWAISVHKPIHAGPLLSFDPRDLPDWTYIWEHDYEALRDVVYGHIQKIVQRYAKKVRVWNVVSGIHAQNNFNLNFEQLMELTRMSCLLVKQIAPESKVMIDLIMPWGEYYARDQRTIPPMLYAEMAVQSGIKFDAFGLHIHMGVPVDGHYVRDLLQVSSLLDEFVRFGKTVHVTSCAVPSAMEPDPWDGWEGVHPVDKGGRWHAAWSPRLQAEWLQAFYRIAISKPFVDTICWRDLADYEGHYIPHGGLCGNDMQPKLAYRELRNFKAALASGNSVVDQQHRKGRTKK